MIDEIDLKIIEILSRNARTPYVDIARELGISDVAVIKRIKKLESEKVIKKYTIIVDYTKLGYSKASITGINVEPDALLNVVEALKDKPYIKSLYITSGDHALIAVIYARDSDELSRIHKEISSIPGVSKVYPSVLVEVVKES